jgi:hypothetical protein
MELPIRSPQNKSPSFLYAIVPLAVTGVLWWSSPYDVSFLQVCAAFILGWIPWYFYRKWSQGERRQIPLFALIAGMYWLAFAVPLFWSSHEIGLVDGNHHLSEDSVTQSLELAVLGVLALLAGMKVAERFHWTPVVNLEVRPGNSGWAYLRVVLIVATLLHLFVSLEAMGAEGRQVIYNAGTILPAVTFTILFRYFLRGEGSDLDRLLVFLYVAVALIAGISSGWLGSFVGLGLMCAAIYVFERRRVPLRAIAIILPVILFLQPAKDRFRERYWHGDSTSSRLERTAFWVDLSWRMWSNALSDSQSEATKQLANQSLNRLSLLQQTANVLERTPDVVPYQYGHLYSYILVTLVPRFAWEDKPSINDANRWYQVSYRLTSPKSLRGVSISVGTLAESFINFGWLGPFLVIVPLGILLGSVERIFFRDGSGVLLNSLGVALLPGFLGIEGQLAQYLGGVAQQIAIALLVLAPVLKFHLKSRDKEFGGRSVLAYAHLSDNSDGLKARAIFRAPHE